MLNLYPYFYLFMVLVLVNNNNPDSVMYDEILKLQCVFSAPLTAPNDITK